MTTERNILTRLIKKASLSYHELKVNQSLFLKLFRLFVQLITLYNRDLPFPDLYFIICYE